MMSMKSFIKEASVYNDESKSLKSSDEDDKLSKIATKNKNENVATIVHHKQKVTKKKKVATFKNR